MCQSQGAFLCVIFMFFKMWYIYIFIKSHKNVQQTQHLPNLREANLQELLTQVYEDYLLMKWVVTSYV